MDIQRVYFYTFYLLVIGCWLLYNKWFVGIGFIALAAFSAYFKEYVFLHNYFASIIIYVGIAIDLIIRRKMKWLILLTIIGVIQGIAFQARVGHYVVGSMEFLSLCVGLILITKTI